MLFSGRHTNDYIDVMGLFFDECYIFGTTSNTISLIFRYFIYFFVTFSIHLLELPGIDLYTVKVLTISLHCSFGNISKSVI